MIAEAAHELGLEGLTLKAVADHLDVSVAALYHHVSGKDDLLRIAADESTRAIPLPVDRGQHWAQWLLDWANYNRAVFTAQPGLLGQYLEGAIQPELVVHNLEAILAVLVREGFTGPGRERGVRTRDVVRARYGRGIEAGTCHGARRERCRGARTGASSTRRRSGNSPTFDGC